MKKLECGEIRMMGGSAVGDTGADRGEDRQNLKRMDSDFWELNPGDSS